MYKKEGYLTPCLFSLFFFVLFCLFFFLGNDNYELPLPSELAQCVSEGN